MDEEMRRLLASTGKMAELWYARRTSRASLDLPLKVGRWASDAGWEDGVRAYAEKQANIRHCQVRAWSGRLASLRVEALGFLDAHSEAGLCVTPLDVAERVAAMTLGPEREEHGSSA